MKKDKSFTLKISFTPKLILILIVSFIAILILQPFRDARDETSLRNRYYELVSLLNEKKYGEAYDQFLADTEKTNTARQKYIDDAVESDNKITNDGVIKTEYSVNEIKIKDNIGFIDRTAIFCRDQECGNKETRRAYKKWLYIGGKWYTTLKEPLCIRDVSYDAAPEFKRALSLVFQRFQETFSDIQDFSNCVDVAYSSSLDEEGVFFFNSNISSREKLVIDVNTSYKYVDDLSTAILLAHELQHASQYLDFIYDNKPKDCIDQEVEAFYSQFLFVRTLNEEERNSIIARISYGQNNNQIETLKEMLPISSRANYICGNNVSKCWVDYFKDGLRAWIQANPYYRNQCNI